MRQFEYLLLDFNTLPRGQSVQDALNTAGSAGWELISYSNLNVAIFKRDTATREDTLQSTFSMADAMRSRQGRQDRDSASRESLKRELESLASAQGLSLGDILDEDIPDERRAPHGPVSTVKFRDPENSGHTWSGRGRMPKWLSEAIASGASKEKFRVRSAEE